MSEDQNLDAPLIQVDFDPGFGCSSILSVYQLEVGLDLLIWRILSSDAYLEHYPYERPYFSPTSLEVGVEWF